MEDNSNKAEQILLNPEAMIRMYAIGAFPMADKDTKEINWYMPDVRTIIPLDKYNYPRSLKKNISNSNFIFKFDYDFLSVVKSCADREKTWISDELIEAYLRMEKLGYVHTVETYLKDELVGGLYGVSYKGAFFGESMFSIIPQASKAALIKLIEHLNEKSFVVLDVQYSTPHLEMFGATEIEFKKYNSLLEKAFDINCIF